MRILLVEDNVEFRQLVKRALLERIPDGIVEEAADAEAAMSMLRRATPDIVLTDIGLPGSTNGLALIARIRHRGPQPPIVIITNHNLPEYRAEAARLGANDFLAKGSSTAQDIVSAVNRLTDGQRTS
jgi:DNA-binding NarL/FixJ family response regulator